MKSVLPSRKFSGLSNEYTSDSNRKVVTLGKKVCDRNETREGKDGEKRESEGRGVSEEVRVERSEVRVDNKVSRYVFLFSSGAVYYFKKKIEEIE